MSFAIHKHSVYLLMMVVLRALNTGGAKNLTDEELRHVVLLGKFESSSLIFSLNFWLAGIKALRTIFQQYLIRL